MISNWKRELLNRGTEIFSTKAPDEEAPTSWARAGHLLAAIARIEIKHNLKIQLIFVVKL